MSYYEEESCRHNKDCPHCQGTGIGWSGPDSACTYCKGSGITKNGYCEECLELMEGEE